MAQGENAASAREVYARLADDSVAETKQISSGIVLKVPDGMTEIAVEGQRFRVEDGIVKIPGALVETARAHVDSVAAAAQRTAARLERELSSEGRAALRKAWNIVRDSVERELSKAP